VNRLGDSLVTPGSTTSSGTSSDDMITKEGPTGAWAVSSTGGKTRETHRMHSAEGP